MDDRDTALARAVRLRSDGSPAQAREALLMLVKRYPSDATIAYQTAWTHDVLGLEAEAAPFYERALGLGGLSSDDRHGAFVGLGSTYRVLGRRDESLRTLRRGLKEFPGDAALTAFLALTLYDAGDHREAVRRLLKALADGGQVRGYERAIAYYADELDSP